MRSSDIWFALFIAILVGIYIGGVFLNIFVSLILVKGIIFEISRNEVLANFVGWLCFIILGIIGTLFYMAILLGVVIGWLESLI